jgi:transposase-like protein
MLKVVPNQPEKINLDDFIRAGAKEMLLHALKLEVDEYVSEHIDEVDENGHRQVVRNGKGKTRKVTTTAGSIDLEAPRVSDKRDGKKFISTVLPPYLRKTPKVESLLPVLYLRGLSTGKIADTLGEYFGKGSMGLSPASISKLIRCWEGEFTEWKRRKITNKYVYIWADGVHMQVRLGDEKKLCLLVIIGVKEDGEKELVAVREGFRESKESWLTVLRDLVSRGLQAPLVAIADGALGFWSATQELEEFKDTKEQRCWVHKIVNVLDKLPKKVQPEVKSLLREMMKAPDRATADRVKNNFKSVYEAKYPKAVECLVKDWYRLTVFFDFPAEHWTSLRTTNPIESSFATVKLRTRVTKGAGSPAAAASMAFKLLLECEKKWRRIRGYVEIRNLLLGVEYKDGVMITESDKDQKAVAL